MTTRRMFLRGIPIDSLTGREIFETITGWMTGSGPSRQIITLNALMLMTALADESFRETIRRADLVIADGFGISAALKRRGHPAPPRLTGIELTRRLLDWCSANWKSVYFYGGPVAVQAGLADRARRQWPGLRSAAFRDGFGVGMDREEISREIRQNRPDLLLAGLGTPYQELFLAEQLKGLKGTVGVGVGGSLEVLAGKKRECPGFLRANGLEWLYRMIREPERFQKLPALLEFFYRFLINTN